MNTLDFLKTILPEHGIHYLALFQEGHRFPGHKVYVDLETMADAIDNMAGSKSVSVYHACASYQKAVIEVEDGEKTKRKYRVPENWDRAKSFWVDIDCGEAKHAKGDGYLTKRDAVVAVFQFSDKIGWPRPMIVDSGNGIHAYWPLTKDIASDKWVKIAKGLKATLFACGVIADPTRTADFASILRPAGSTNRKNGDAKPVIVKSQGTPTEPKVLASALQEFMEQHGVKLIKEAPKREYVAPGGLNDDLTCHLPQYPDLPVDADEMANKCAQVAAMRDTMGDVGYEPWRGVIGLLKHCVDGRETAEQWSSKREETGHAQLDWDIRYDSWGAGPTTCEFFQGCNPSGCEGCPMKGKIKTPLVLGRQMPVNEETVEEVVTEEGVQLEVEVPALITGYTWSNGVMARMIPDKEGVLQPHPFSSVLFYPTSRIRTEEGTYRIGVRMHMPNHKVRDFDMSTEAMASQTDMLRAMARYELMQSNHKDAGSHMAAYLRDQLEALKRNVEEVNTLTSFGWRPDMSGFLLGDRLYCKDGTVRKVLVGSGAGKFAPNLPAPKGTLERYASAINFMYNREGAEHWQYAVCSGWGSILTPFGEDLYKGLLVAIQGGDSGKGKTTACYSSLYAFGNAEKMALKSEDGFTQNGLWAFLGVFNNLPVLLDELTDMDGPTFSTLAYGISRGEEKVRMTSKGGVVGFANTAIWRMSPFVTGNKDFHGLLATNQANSQAEAVRLIQISVDRYPVVRLHDNEQIEAELVQTAVDAMKANAGAAGDAMLRHVVTHQRQMADAVRDMMNRLAEHIPGTKYRFYRNHGACTLVMAKVARDLGIVDFDIDKMFDFTVGMLKDLAETVAVTNTVTAEDAFSRMMSALSHRILVTQEFRDKRNKSGPETPRNRPTGEIAGRFVLGSTSVKEHAGHVILSQKEARDWCMTNRVDFNAMLDSLDQRTALVKRHDKLVLTRGTDVSFTGQVRCFIVDSNKLDKDALTLVSHNPSVGVDEKAVGDV
jgi:hypothetical protein